MAKARGRTAGGAGNGKERTELRGKEGFEEKGHAGQGEDELEAGFWCGGSEGRCIGRWSERQVSPPPFPTPMEG